MKNCEDKDIPPNKWSSETTSTLKPVQVVELCMWCVMCVCVCVCVVCGVCVCGVCVCVCVCVGSKGTKHAIQLLKVVCLGSE